MAREFKEKDEATRSSETQLECSKRGETQEAKAEEDVDRERKQRKHKCRGYSTPASSGLFSTQNGWPTL